MPLLTEGARVLDLVEGLDGFAPPTAPSLPGKAIHEIAVMLTAGGDCPAKHAMLEERQHFFGKSARAASAR